MDKIYQYTIKKRDKHISNMIILKIYNDGNGFQRVYLAII